MNDEEPVVSPRPRTTDDFDVVDVVTTLSDRRVDVIDIAAAGIMLVTSQGERQVVTSSSEARRVVELFEVHSDEGPCLNLFRTETGSVNDDDVVMAQALADIADIATIAIIQNALPSRRKSSTLSSRRRRRAASPTSAATR